MIGLRERVHDAVLLDHRHPHARRAAWRCTFQPLLPRRDFARYAAKARKFIRAADARRTSPPFALEQPETLSERDLVIVGSDEG